MLIKTLETNSYAQAWNEGAVHTDAFFVKRNNILFIGLDCWWIGSEKSSILFFIVSSIIKLKKLKFIKLPAWIILENHPPNFSVNFRFPFGIDLVYVWETFFAPVDAKYRSATAPLVFIYAAVFLENVFLLQAKWQIPICLCSIVHHDEDRQLSIVKAFSRHLFVENCEVM